MASNTVFLVCVIIITLTNIFIALTVGLVLLRISGIMMQVERFFKAVNTFTASGMGAIGTVLGALIGLLGKR